jgi:hypothetical protein
MEEKIRQQLKIENIRKYKKPTILMHETDFENLKKYVEYKVTNLKLGDYPTFEGIPIRTSRILEIGNFIIYDDYLKSWNDYGIQIQYRFDETLGYDSVRLSKVFTSRHDIIDYFNSVLDE